MKSTDFSIHTLSSNIEKLNNDLNERKNHNQIIANDHACILDANKLTSYLESSSSVEVTFEVKPSVERLYSRVEIFNDDEEGVTESEPPLPLKPLTYWGKLVPGCFTINVSIEPPQPDYQEDLRNRRTVVNPPYYEKIWNVEYE